jgi:hypothetical protein
VVNSARAHHAHFSPAAVSAIFLATSRRYLGLTGGVKPLRVVHHQATGEFVDPAQYRISAHSSGGRAAA